MRAIVERMPRKPRSKSFVFASDPKTHRCVWIRKSAITMVTNSEVKGGHADGLRLVLVYVGSRPEPYHLSEREAKSAEQALAILE